MPKERTTQLLRERLCLLKMTENIHYFTSKLCSCMKSKKSNVHHEAPVKTMTSAAPLKLIGIEFLHLTTCSGN